MAADRNQEGLENGAAGLCVFETGKGRFVEEMLRRTQSRKLCAYGAAAKGNTLLNFCGIDHHYISGVIDQNPEKQGKYTPGSRIPVIAEPDHLTEPVLLLPWNLESED